MKKIVMFLMLVVFMLGCGSEESTNVGTSTPINSTKELTEGEKLVADSITNLVKSNVTKFFTSSRDGFGSFEAPKVEGLNYTATLILGNQLQSSVEGINFVYEIDRKFKFVFYNSSVGYQMDVVDLDGDKKAVKRLSLIRSSMNELKEAIQSGVVLDNYEVAKFNEFNNAIVEAGFNSVMTNYNDPIGVIGKNFDISDSKGFAKMEIVIRNWSLNLYNLEYKPTNGTTVHKFLTLEELLKEFEVIKLQLK